MTGVTAGQISIRGNVTRDPIVQGDTCTYIAETGGQTYGYVHKVPSGSLIRQFSI